MRHIQPHKKASYNLISNDSIGDMDILADSVLIVGPLFQCRLNLEALQEFIIAKQALTLYILSRNCAVELLP